MAVVTHSCRPVSTLHAGADRFILVNKILCFPAAASAGHPNIHFCPDDNTLM